MFGTIPKSILVKLDFSGCLISFLSPVNYSKDYPWPSETQHEYDIYDKELYKNPYTELENTYSIRQSYWDYGRGIIFGEVNGALSMSIVLFKASGNNINIKNNDEFIVALKKDFEIVYDKQAREEFGVELPDQYQIKNISSLDWGYYEYIMGRGERHVAYAIPVSEQNYLLITFNFINNSHGKKNNWKEQAQVTIDFIMSSFKID